MKSKMVPLTFATCCCPAAHALLLLCWRLCCGWAAAEGAGRGLKLRPPTKFEKQGLGRCRGPTIPGSLEPPSGRDECEVSFYLEDQAARGVGKGVASGAPQRGKAGSHARFLGRAGGDSSHEVVGALPGPIE